MTAPDQEVSGAGRSPIRGLRRLIRVSVLGGASLGLATAAHLVGGGRLPSPGVLTIAGLLVGLAAVTLTAKRCRFGLLLSVLAVEQTVLHLVFDAATSAATCGPTHGATMTHSAEVSCASLAAMAQMSAPSSAMWVGHLIATLLTAGLLARGEACLWRVANRIVQAATAAPAGRRERMATTEVVAGPPEKLRSPAVHAPAAPRGPPKVVVAF